MVAVVANIPTSSAESDPGELISWSMIRGDRVMDFFGPSRRDSRQPQEEELAFIFHWSPSEIERLTIPELLRWHAAGIRMLKERYGEGDDDG